MPLELKVHSVLEYFAPCFHIGKILFRPRRIKLLIRRLLRPLPRRNCIHAIDVERLVIRIEGLLLRYLGTTGHAPLERGACSLIVAIIGLVRI